jgi:hypothetical protein
MLKKIILAIAAIGVSSAALAHHGRDDERERATGPGRAGGRHRHSLPL